MDDSFNALCDLLEVTGDCELYTIKEMHGPMVGLSENKVVYTEKHLKNKLKAHYGKHLFFAQLPGRADVVCLITWHHTFFIN